MLDIFFFIYLNEWPHPFTKQHYTSHQRANRIPLLKRKQQSNGEKKCILLASFGRREVRCIVLFFLFITPVKRTMLWPASYRRSFDLMNKPSHRALNLQPSLIKAEHEGIDLFQRAVNVINWGHVLHNSKQTKMTKFFDCF